MTYPSPSPTPSFPNGGPAPFNGYTGPVTPNHTAFPSLPHLALTGVTFWPLAFVAVAVIVAGAALVFFAVRHHRLHRF
jgi:predicted membrane protein